MNKKPAPIGQWQQAVERLRQSLGQTGLISQGSVQDRTARRGGGAGYQWTRKVDQKTVTVALTPDQYELMKEAVHNYRTVRRYLREWERLSRRIIFYGSPHPSRRKRLSQKVLGLM
jgi:hypothetical protein